MSVAVIARGAWSPLGNGLAATRTAPVGEPASSCSARDAELAAAGLLRPFLARAAVRVPPATDRATALLADALAACLRELDAALPEWRSLRVGAAIGTSSGGMRAFEDHFADARANDPERTRRGGAATYIGPLVDAHRVVTAGAPLALEPVSLVLGACASSTIAIGLGRVWLLSDQCDVAICGGFDAVGEFVAAGFECLRATCGERAPRPFRMDREGLVLGEGAAVVALVRARHAGRSSSWIRGFSATCDAAHLTAPDFAGVGLARAAEAALAEAGVTVGLVSAHGTATKHNDAAEAASLRRLALDVPLFALKGTIGHTLGAAGVLETLAAIDALANGVAPATFGEGALEPGVTVLDRTAPSTATAALKLSSAFGGANAAVVVAKEPGPSPAFERTVFVSAAVHVGLEDADAARLTERTGYPADRILRADDLVRLTMSATAKLEDAHGGRGAFRGAGIVVGLGLATIETNALFLERLRTHGAAKGEPRRFPFTTPNAGAGECGVVFGLTGPAFAVGGGPHGGIEALAIAADLVRSGVAERIVVVAADHAGPASERIAPGTASGAVALLVSATAPVGAGRGGRLAGAAVRFDETSEGMPDLLPPMDAHRALLPLVAPTGPETAPSVNLPWGGIARARVIWL